MLNNIILSESALFKVLNLKPKKYCKECSLFTVVKETVYCKRCTTKIDKLRQLNGK